MDKENQNPLKIDDFLAKVDQMRREGGVDLNAAEDLSLAVMNLLSLEEHFFFTGSKTGKDEYFDMTNEIRQMRRELMERLVDKHEGETWCATKHLLSATMRMIEVANRYQAENMKDEAKAMYARAYKTYGIFWALKMKLASLEKCGGEDKREGGLPAQAGEWSVEDLVDKLADCCNEK
jgi:hypothetical protein